MEKEIEQVKNEIDSNAKDYFLYMKSLKPQSGSL